MAGKYDPSDLKKIGNEARNRLPPASAVQGMFLYEMQRQTEDEKLFDAAMFRLARAETVSDAHKDLIDKLEEKVEICAGRHSKEQSYSLKGMKALSEGLKARGTGLEVLEDRKAVYQNIAWAMEELDQETNSSDEKLGLVAMLVACHLKDTENKLQAELTEAEDRITKLEDLVRVLTAQKSPMESPKATMRLPITTTTGQTLDLSVPKGSPLVPFKEKKRPSSPAPLDSVKEPRTTASTQGAQDGSAPVRKAPDKPAPVATSQKLSATAPPFNTSITTENASYVGTHIIQPPHKAKMRQENAEPECSGGWTNTSSAINQWGGSIGQIVEKPLPPIPAVKSRRDASSLVPTVQCPEPTKEGFQNTESTKSVDKAAPFNAPHTTVTPAVSISTTSTPKAKKTEGTEPAPQLDDCQSKATKTIDSPKAVTDQSLGTSSAPTHSVTPTLKLPHHQNSIGQSTWGAPAHSGTPAPKLLHHQSAVAQSTWGAPAVAVNVSKSASGSTSTGNPTPADATTSLPSNEAKAREIGDHEIPEAVSKAMHRPAIQRMLFQPPRSGFGEAPKPPTQTAKAMKNQIANYIAPPDSTRTVLRENQTIPRSKAPVSAAPLPVLTSTTPVDSTLPYKFSTKRPAVKMSSPATPFTEASTGVGSGSSTPAVSTPATLNTAAQTPAVMARATAASIDAASNTNTNTEFRPVSGFGASAANKAPKGFNANAATFAPVPAFARGPATAPAPRIPTPTFAPSFAFAPAPTRQAPPSAVSMMSPAMQELFLSKMAAGNAGN